MRISMFFMMAACLVAGGCKNEGESVANAKNEVHTAPAQPAAKPEQVVAAPKPIEPFGVEMNGNKRLFPEACFMNSDPAWEIMAPLPGHKACDLMGEDDFSLSIRLEMAEGKDGKTPLPAPGQTFEAMIYLPTPDIFEGRVHIKVLNHAKPYVTLAVTPTTLKASPGAKDLNARVSIGGSIRVLLPPENEFSADPNSWQ